ncbi:hypothetical protein [Anaerosinus gibii]|uniref:Uncharacterized protein n=1 Tax=Selenobaculum gibii TaxID=3054208 RepID=A0A9Y2AFD0_9FIRM|nr:hypothetical protein [Selenobaculum gbiensis]WIW70600.1 hypothetical protein P3F81_12050 [Selenobaculum gbiensis]
MANLAEVNEWIEGIYQLEEDDPVMGGADGVDNRPHKELANRTKFLKLKIEKLAEEISKMDTVENHNQDEYAHQNAFNKHNTDSDSHEDIRTAITEATKKAGLPVGFEYTIPYTELQPGQLPLLGGKYPKSTFEDLWKWVQTHPSLIKTETEWQAISTASGGREVPFYADVDDTYFRVPLMTTWVRGASSVDEVGTVLEAGLPNITGTASNFMTNATEGAFSDVVTTGTRGNVGTGSYNYAQKINFDASLSNAIYGKSTTVQPQSICRLWVVQAFGTNSNVGNLDMAQLAADLVTKAATDLSNITSAGKKIIASMSMPSSTFETIVDAGATTTYTAPANGYVCAKIATNTGATTQNRFVSISSSKLGSMSNYYHTSSDASTYIPVLKNDVVTISHDPVYTGLTIKFIYAEGEI